MYGNSLVNCSSCLTPLQVPTAAPSIRCALCHAITNIPVVDHRSAPHEWTRSLTAVPSPYNHAPVGPIPNVYGNKRAVICGISYRNSKQELKGCINDSKCMHYLLTNKFKFPDASIVMLNGHGSQQRNLSGEEIDGYDETICPVDFQTAGMIVDDEINAMIVRPLPPGVKLHALIDACHSGTVLDLPYLCRMNTAGRYIWEDHRPRSGAWKGTSGGEAISFSGCDDNQTSADTSALSKVTSTGAMTYCFIQAIESGQAATYGDILTAMRTAIRSVGAPGRGSGGASSLMNMLVTGGSVAGGILKQEPQLTANETFDAYAKPFSL